MKAFIAATHIKITLFNATFCFVLKKIHKIGPLQKATNRKEYNRVVDGLMLTKGITREEAEKEYNAFLQNPNDYALNKVRC